MISVTMEQLLAMSDVLARLAQHRFPAGRQAIAYRLSKIQRAVTSELKYFHNERRRLIEELGQSRNATQAELSSGADLTVWEVLPGSSSWTVFSLRLKELLGVQAELACPRLPLNMLDSVELSARDLEVLDALVDDAVEVTTSQGV